MVHGLGVRGIHSDSHTNIIVTNAKLQARTRTGKACTTVIVMPEWAEAHTPTPPPNSPAPPMARIWADPQRPRQTSSMRSSLLHPRGLARAVNADPGATPHLCLIQMNCNISSFEAPQNSMTRVTGKGYSRGRARNQYSLNTVSSVFRNHSAISFNWKGRSSSSRSRLSNSVISPAVLGFLIGFNARKTWSLRGRLESGIFFIAGSTVSKN
jgi:hypothetical protein